jgi:hypothetical protein
MAVGSSEPEADQEAREGAPRPPRPRWPKASGGRFAPVVTDLILGLVLHVVVEDENAGSYESDERRPPEEWQQPRFRYWFAPPL